MKQSIVTMLVALAILTLPSSASAERKPAAAIKPSMLVTYRFTARITDNAGVTPFKVGTTITGQFTYDLTAKNTKNAGPKFFQRGRYLSKRNTFLFKCGKTHMESIGMVVVNTGTVPQIAEGFSVVASDVTLPEGWKLIKPRDRKDRSRAFGIEFQNYPPQGVLPTAKLPKSLDLKGFKNVKSVFLDFYYGVAFPGGIVAQRAKVEAKIEKLEPVPGNRNKKP